MRVVTVTRRHVLDAIRYNNLIAKNGWFVDSEDPDCPACLVGATMRRAVRRKRWWDKDLYWLTVKINDALRGWPITDEVAAENCARRGNFLAALSCKFEGMTSGNPERGRYHGGSVLTKTQQKRLVGWVKENIPASFEALL